MAGCKPALNSYDCLINLANAIVSSLNHSSIQYQYQPSSVVVLYFVPILSCNVIQRFSISHYLTILSKWLVFLIGCLIITGLVVISLLGIQTQRWSYQLHCFLEDNSIPTKLVYQRCFSCHWCSRDTLLYRHSDR